MRLPSKPDSLENKPVSSGSDVPSAGGPVSRDPSYPDRARIDSDVRAFLRPVSTPWIVFDRDSRIDVEGRSAIDGFAKSALRVGAVFASNPSFRPEVVGMFPHSSPESVVEPSSLVVASDVMPDSSSAIPLDGSREVAVSDALFGPAVLPRRGRLGAIAGACGVLAMAGVIVALAAGGTHAPQAAAPKSVELPTAAAAALVAPPPAETAIAPAPANEPSATSTTTTNEPAAAKAPTDPKKRFGKLTIKAEAKHKNVWFDGKRMLGSGQRSFLVFCGMHTVAVSDKADTKDIEIPCNGEYVVSK